MEEKNYKIYDSLYNVIGVAPYEEVHTQGLLHQVVHFWLAEKKDDQLWFYLQKRAEDDIVYKGAYDILTSGHIDPEETHEEAMVHQIKEQLGLFLEKEQLTYIGHIHQQIKKDKYFDNTFVQSYLYVTDHAEKDFADNLVEDVKIRKFIKKRLYDAGISKITIERTAGRVKISVYTAKPGIVIGKNGASIEALKAELQKMTAQKVAVNIEEVKRPELDAQLVAENIALQLENRVTFRRAMKQAMGRTMKFGAKGIKTMVSGRLGGADIARGESYHEGTIPLQTLRADIDYGFAEADTTYGKLGVKVWIYKGEVLPTKANKEGGAQ